MDDECANVDRKLGCMENRKLCMLGRLLVGLSVVRKEEAGVNLK